MLVYISDVRRTLTVATNTLLFSRSIVEPVKGATQNEREACIGYGTWPLALSNINAPGPRARGVDTIYERV